MDLRYRAGTSIRHVFGAVAEGALIVAIGAALVFGFAVTTGHSPVGAGSTLARGSSSIWIDDSGTYKSASQLTFSDPVMFGYKSGTATSIQLHCYQPVGSDNLVFADARMLYEGGVGYGEPFQLGPSAAWDGGAATCKAMLGHRSNSGKYMVEASLKFDVAK